MGDSFFYQNPACFISGILFHFLLIYVLCLTSSLKAQKNFTENKVDVKLRTLVFHGYTLILAIFSFTII